MPTLSAAQIKAYATAAGVTGQNATIATAIALAESSGNTDDTHVNSNGTTDYGLWQINSVHSALLAAHNWKDPGDNATMMASISNGGTNWKPWSTYTSGAYLAHMSGASVSADPTATGGVQTAAAIDNPFSALQQFAQIISDPRTWIRMGMVIGGATLILIAVHMSAPEKAKTITRFLPVPLRVVTGGAKKLGDKTPVERPGTSVDARNAALYAGKKVPGVTPKPTTQAGN